MPELPEVQTTVDGLNKTVRGLVIADVWTDVAGPRVARPDYRETIKYLPFFNSFKKAVVGKKIISAERRAKNILINLSGPSAAKASAGKHTILIHMKMTGHMMYGKYAFDKKQNLWSPAPDEKNAALRDPFNKFLHVVFSFANGKQLVLSDMRKFAKVTLVHEGHFDHLGPEPLEKNFTFKKFLEQINTKKAGKIKSVLMDQTVISGVGNIYSDEALWLSGIHPLSIVSKIPQKNLNILFISVKKVLEKGIDFGGDSTSDYRRIDGTRGKFSAEHNAYRLTGKKCTKPACKGVILRMVIGGRSAHFCSIHQKLFS